MSALVLDGKLLLQQIEMTLRTRVAAIKARPNGVAPMLAVILVGGDSAAHSYVKMKGGACARIGMELLGISLSFETTTKQLLAKIDELNRTPQVHGILLQYPVPPHIDARECFNRIALEKDIDGVTALSLGRMTLRLPAYGAATAMGAMRLLEHFRIPLEGKHAVVVGRTALLGKPMALMLLRANATVTICHVHTRGLAELVRSADILVGAIGKPAFIKGAWIKPGAVIVDMGFHPEAGRLGDIELATAVDKCSAYTPVPGSIGPMTIAMLLEQTMEAADRSTKFRQL